MKVTVKITKKVLKQSMNCGGGNDSDVQTNCAVALAVRDIFPQVKVQCNYYQPFGNQINANHNGESFIKEFDKLVDSPKERLKLPETIIELQITEEILSELNKKNNWQEIVNNSENLTLK